MPGRAVPVDLDARGNTSTAATLAHKPQGQLVNHVEDEASQSAALARARALKAFGVGDTARLQTVLRKLL